MRQRIMTALALIASLAVVALAGAQPTRAYHEGDDATHPFADTAFEATWERSDAAVTPGGTETWLWGPSPYTEGMQEEYADSPGGERLVQYFDKSRMEINCPADEAGCDGVDPDSVWYVTNGLLVVEMVEGWYQVGDAEFDESPDPAEVNIAGDPTGAEGVGPTYADINTYGLRAEPAIAAGADLTSRIDGEGAITTDAALAEHDVTGAMRLTVPGIDHTVASVFWDRMVEIGEDYDDNAWYVTGYPITEAYWSEVEVGGTPQDVLWQCFERRCLTYTPDNEAQWQVEMGNVGQHYYAWRYGEEPTPPPADGATQSFLVDLGALNDSGVTGTARLTLEGNALTVLVSASGLTASEIHNMHLHGFGDGTAAACPTDEADADEDGTIGLAEAVAVTGGVIVPLTPFPSAGEDGTIAFNETITLTDDQLAKLGDLTKTVIMLHGADVDDEYAGDLPVACGDVAPAGDGTAGDDTVTATIHDADGAELGTVDFSEVAAGIQAVVALEGLEAGEHGFHIHDHGICTGDFTSAGGHLAFDEQEHPFHAGDLPNLVVGEDGAVEVTIVTNAIDSLAELDDANGSAIVVHAGADDYATPPSGNSGARVGCGVIYATGDGDDGDGTPVATELTATLDALNESGASGTATLSLAGSQLDVHVEAAASRRTAARDAPLRPGRGCRRLPDRPR